MNRIHQARDFLLLESMSARAAAVPDDKRRTARPHLDHAHARHLAGESLAEGTEAAQALADAITESLAAVDALDVDDPLVVRRAKEARTALAERDAVALPVFISDACAAHQALYEAIAPYALDVRSLRRAQIRRALSIVLFAIAAVWSVVWYARRPPDLRAEASAVYSPQFFPFRAVDGDTTSEWLLPDRTVGWIEITISPPRMVKKVRLMNARNSPYNDRATGAFRVEAFLSGEALGAADGAFDGFHAEPTWREVELDGRKADKIKVWIKSFTSSGAGFAEITIE